MRDSAGLVGGDPGSLRERQDGGRRKECRVGRVGTGEPPSEPARLSRACASGPRPATRALLRIKTNICVACCVYWRLAFFSRLKIGASPRDVLPLLCPSPRPPPGAGQGLVWSSGLLPSFDLTAGDRSLEVSENDYGITAVREGDPSVPGQATPGGQASAPGATAPLRLPPGTPSTWQ